MWPQLLDLDREACLGILRRLEVEAYSSVAKALRAQGELSKERRRILSDLSNALSIPLERHKAEMRRVANDELLSTIAHTLGDPSFNGWALEGRRIIPLLRRALPLTSLYNKAQEAKNKASAQSETSPLPEKTRSRAPPPPLKKGRYPPPVSLEDTLSNGPPSVALPQRPSLPEDIVLLPSGMAVRFRREGKSGPFTTEIIPPPSSSTTIPARGKEQPSKKTTSKKTTAKRKAVASATSANTPEAPKKSKPQATCVSQAGHAYARPPFGGSNSSPAPSLSNPLPPPATPPSTPQTTVVSSALKPPPKVVLVADPSKSSEVSSPSPGLLPKLPNTMSKETVAKLIQSAGSPGARILPKPGQQAPIYVLAAPAGTNVATSSLPSATRILSTAQNNSSGNNNISNTTLPRVLQVSPVRSTPPAPTAVSVIPSSSSISNIGGSTLRTIQSGGAMRTFTTTPQVPSIRHSAGGKPSVIVVQRKTPPNSNSSPSAQNNTTLKTTTLTTKDLINKQTRIYQPPKAGAKPLVIVSKPQSLPSSTSATAPPSSTVTTTSNQNNVIVLDLSREQLKNNSILTDLLHASGMLGDSGESKKANNKLGNALPTPVVTTSSSGEPIIPVQSPSERPLEAPPKVMVIEKSVSSSLDLMDNGFQKENIKVLKPSNNSITYGQDLNEAVVTIPQTSKTVSLDKVPVEIEGVLHGSSSPVETMEDITSFIEESGTNHYQPEKGTAK